MISNDTAYIDRNSPSDGAIRGRFFYVQRRGVPGYVALRCQPGAPLVFYMTKINLDTNLFGHPKIRRLRTYCDQNAEIYLIRLWAYAAEFHPKDGSFKGYENTEIEGLAGWTGPSGNLLFALKKVGLMDEDVRGTLKIHDWQIHAGFVWKYKEAGRTGGIRSGKSRRIKSNPPSTLPSTRGSTIELNGIELNKDLLDPPKPASKVGEKVLTDIQKVVGVFKVTSGYQKEDKAWDQLNFRRCSRSAKQLLDFLSDWKTAGNCIQDVYEKLSSKGLTVTLETICKHAADWKKDQQEVLG